MKFDFKYTGDFLNEVAVVCPNCHAKALVSSSYTTVYEARFVCPNCAMNKVWEGDTSSFVTAHVNYEQETGMLFGPPVDSFFKCPLWYQIDCKGEVLYAYNLAHLNFLKLYVGAGLRERTQAAYGWSNQSLQSRLPKWMLASKNRLLISKKLRELEKK